jgi:hypothetical protein
VVALRTDGSLRIIAFRRVRRMYRPPQKLPKYMKLIARIIANDVELTKQFASSLDEIGVACGRVLF